jgi:hypothetical protein
LEDGAVQLAARDGSTVIRAHRGAVYDVIELEFVVDDAMPARQIKWDPMEHAHGLHVIATDVRVEGADSAYKYSGAAPVTPWLRFPAIRVEFGGGWRETTRSNNACVARADSIEF